MERIWLKSYPEGVQAEIDPNAFRSLGEFFAASVAKFRRPDRLHQHGEGDLVWRAGREVARVRGLPAKRSSPAARRSRRIDAAEPPPISDRLVRGAARRLRRGQLQPALLGPRAWPSARRFWRGSDRGAGELRHHAREGDWRNGRHNCRGHRRRRSIGRAAGPDRQSSLYDTSGARSRPFASSARSASITRSNSERGRRSRKRLSSRPTSRFCNTPAGRPAWRRGRC